MLALKWAVWLGGNLEGFIFCSVCDYSFLRAEAYRVFSYVPECEQQESLFICPA
jgi:hypothetical protein